VQDKADAKFEKKGRPKSTLKKSLGEDAYKAFLLWAKIIFCASANSAIAVANDATTIYKFEPNFATFIRLRDQNILVAVRQN
jgi:hypothetical protein